MGDIWEIAKQMELEGKEYYTTLAENVEWDEVRGVLLFLAGQEEDHFKLFDFLQEGQTPSIKQAQDAYTVAKEAFKKITPDFQHPESSAHAASAYRKAVIMEQKTIDYYTEILAQTKDFAQKDIIKTIINEEVKHRVLMEAMSEFVNKPIEWLENAEFNHLEEYE